MRSKKRILLIDSNEARLSVRRYMLGIRGFLVFGAETIAEARGLSNTCAPELVIAASDVPNLQWGLTAMHEDAAHILQMVLHPAKGECSIVADAVAYNPTAEEIYERARIMSARKRGPRKKLPVAVGSYSNLIVQDGQVIRRIA